MKPQTGDRRCLVTADLNDQPARDTRLFEQIGWGLSRRNSVNKEHWQEKRKA